MEPLQQQKGLIKDEPSARAGCQRGTQRGGDVGLAKERNAQLRIVPAKDVAIITRGKNDYAIY
jgi:hypothetical protein